MPPYVASTNTNFDILIAWTQKVAENTAQIRDQVMKGGGFGGRPGGAAPAGSADDPGRLDRVLDSSMRRLEGMIAGALGQALGQARGLANRGLAGTAEGARQDYAMEMLSRQFAAVMLPVFQGFTYFTEQIERRMRGMTGGEQNRLLGAGIGAYAGLQYFGPLGALAGGALGAGLTGGSPAAAALGGAYLGFRVAGPAGAVAGAAAGAAGAAPPDYSTERPSDYWGRMRRRTEDGGAGMNWLEAALATGGRAIGRTVGLTEARPGAPPGRPPPEAPRRDVTPFNAQMGDAGSNYFRLQEQVVRVTAGQSEDGGPLKPFFDLLLNIAENMGKLVGITSGGSTSAAPLPASATGASAPAPAGP